MKNVSIFKRFWYYFFYATNEMFDPKKRIQKLSAKSDFSKKFWQLGCHTLCTSAIRRGCTQFTFLKPKTSFWNPNFVLIPPNTRIFAISLYYLSHCHNPTPTSDIGTPRGFKNCVSNRAPSSTKSCVCNITLQSWFRFSRKPKFDILFWP